MKESVNSDTPLYVQIADYIRKDIKNGVIKPGDQLASEHDLMKRYNVSRMTVRNAFSALVNEGLIEKRHGKGSFCKSIAAKKNIDVLLCMSDHYFVSYYLQSINAVLEKSNANLIAGDTKNSNAEIIRRLNAIALRGSDGVILQGCPKSDVDKAAFCGAIKKLEEKKIPLIVIDYEYPFGNMSCAAMNEKKIGTVAALHLQSRGHTKIAAVYIENDALSQKRIEGLTEVFHDPLMINHDGLMHQHTREAVAFGATALFCYNDTIAQECIDFLNGENIGVPEDISLISVDDTILANVYHITSVSHAKNIIGEYAAKEILSAAPKTRIFDPILIERDSVKDRKGK